MKKLTGMKSSFSSLENKKLKDLKSIHGGLAEAGSASINIQSNVNVGPDCSEVDTYSDDAGRRYLGRLVVCGPYPA